MCTKRFHLSPTLILFLELSSLSLIYFIIFYNVNYVIVAPDSEEYMEVAQSMFSGEYFSKRTLRDTSYAETIRTPVYSAIMLLAFSDNAISYANLLGIHAITALLTIFTVCLCFKNICPPFVTGSFLLFGFYSVKEYYNTLLPEWLCICTLIVLFTLIVSHLEVQKYIKFLFIGLVASFLTLLRPALIITLLTPLIMLFITRPKQVWSYLTVYFISIIPVAGWIGINCDRVGKCALAPVSGYSFYAAISPVLKPKFGEADRNELYDFATIVASLNTPVDGFPIENIYRPNSEFIEHLVGNVRKAKATFVEQGNWDYVKLNDMMIDYAFKAATDNWGAYLKYVFTGFSMILDYLFLVLGAVALFLLAKAEKFRKPLVYGIWILLIFHLIHTLLSASIGAVLDRYLIITGIPFSLAVGIGIATAISDFLKTRLPSVNRKTT